MKRYLTKDWNEVYNILKKESTGIVYVNEPGYGIIINFILDGITHTVKPVTSYGFDLRKQKEDFIGKVIFEYVEARTSDNWHGENKRHEHYNSFMNLYNKFFTIEQLQAMAIDKKISTLTSKCFSLKNEKAELVKTQAALFPEKLQLFTADLQLAIEKLTAAKAAIRPHKHDYDEILFNQVYAVYNSIDRDITELKQALNKINS